jgi:hypothetical protein
VLNVKEVDELTVTDPASTTLPPIVTEVSPATKLAPLIVTAVPPAVGPDVGANETVKGISS